MMLGMLADIFYVATGRTALVIIPVLLLLFAVKTFDYARRLHSARGRDRAWRRSPGIRRPICASARWRLWVDFRNYEKSDEQNSSGERIEFAKKSLAFRARRAGHRPRHRLDPRAVREIGCGKDRRPRLGDHQSAQPDLRRGDPARSGRRFRALGDVDRAPALVPRRRPGRTGSGLSSSCRISSVRCSTRICSISCKAGFTWSASASRAAWCSRQRAAKGSSARRAMMPRTPHRASASGRAFWSSRCAVWATCC